MILEMDNKEILDIIHDDDRLWRVAHEAAETLDAPVVIAAARPIGVAQATNQS